jgi:hypothetical protein
LFRAGTKLNVEYNRPLSKVSHLKLRVNSNGLPQHSQNPTRTNRSSGLIRNSYLLNKQMIIDNSCLGLATQDERFIPFLVIKIKGNDLTFGLGIIILQGVSRRKSLAGVNIMWALSR